MWYFKLQVLIYKDVKDLKKQTSDLQRQCRFFGIELICSPRWADSFYVTLPTSPYDACMVINALEGYFYFHDIAHRMSWDDSDGPLVDVLGEIENLYYEPGEWHNKTKHG